MHRRLIRLTIASAAALCIYPAYAENNEYQPYTLPSNNPGSYDEVKKVVIEGESDDPMENIPANLQEALCGGWDFGYEVNGVFGQRESVCPPSGDELPGAKCEDSGGTVWAKTGQNEWRSGGGTKTDAQMDADSKQTEPSRGLIAKVSNVPGRDTVRAFGNLLSGLGMRRETGGTAPSVQFSPGAGRRIETGQMTGFDYPRDAQTSGLTTLCRPPSHPDRRQTPPYQNHGLRDDPGFFCDHPCQRPLDNPGKPGNWDETDSSKVRCGSQQPYAPEEDRVKYSCGGKQTKGPGQGFTAELNANGQLGGVCQDINNWVYILWRKMVHICLEDGGVTPVPIYLYEKGTCGFPEEADQSEHSKEKRADNWTEAGMFECCSDDPFPYGKAYSYTHKGKSCIPCNGYECRLYPTTDKVIVNDIWLDPFPSDLPSQCLQDIPWGDPVALGILIANLIGMGINPADPGVNIGVWADPDPKLRKIEQDREYISYFRDYNNATYERAPLQPHVRDDDNKKANIPVACYGMYDMAPEDAKKEKLEDNDKRCTIAAYYDAGDGDGDQVNFWNMGKSQKGRGVFRDFLNDNPFNDPKRPFTEDESLWFPELGSAFSMLNDNVFAKRYRANFALALLATDSAKQRATVQLDTKRVLSSGALIRTPDDTVTIEKDFTKDRRTMVEWWHVVETEMHKNFTPPTVRLVLPTTWSADLNALDPIYTPRNEERERSPDIRSETIEVQVQATEDLLGSIASFLERMLLLRVEEEPIPVVVPIISPTDLRALAQGWEVWGKKQDEEGLPGGARAREVAEKLAEYADRADDVRALRAELPRYAGRLLAEQKKVSAKTAKWLTDNVAAYEQYLIIDWGTGMLKFLFALSQDAYRKSHDNDAFPWCRNDRFTSPIYSLLDPWLPGREYDGDTTGGFGPYVQCVRDLQNFDISACGQGEQTVMQCVQNGVPSCGGDMTPFTRYLECVLFVTERRTQDPAGSWPTFEVCEQFFPLPPKFPELPNTERDPDIELDFTAFREVQRSVKLPVLKPVQIKIDFHRVRPPALEQDEEPEYPDLADLPAFSEELSDKIKASIPQVITPTGDDFDLFKEAAVLAETEDDPEDPFPKIEIPTMDLLALSTFLYESRSLIERMTREYKLFWESITKERCKEGESSNDCVRPGTEQDCVEPYHDPKGRCVHFEADLKERLQRIGARPAIFLKDDIRSAGEFREPLIQGQDYCEREDWACQLLNKMERKPREGWMLDITDSYDPKTLLLELRNAVRDASSNIIEDDAERFLYDAPQEEMFENFRVPEGERIERYIERFEPEPLEPGEECNDAFCTPPPEETP